VPQRALLEREQTAHRAYLETRTGGIEQTEVDAVGPSQRIEGNLIGAALLVDGAPQLQHLRIHLRVLLHAARLRLGQALGVEGLQLDAGVDGVHARFEALENGVGVGGDGRLRRLLAVVGGLRDIRVRHADLCAGHPSGNDGDDHQQRREHDEPAGARGKRREANHEDSGAYEPGLPRSIAHVSRR
jgi:hypothetical protein